MHKAESITPDWVLKSEGLLTILIKFLLLLVVRHLFLVANIVTTSKALVTSSDALVPGSFLLLWNYGHTKP